MNEGDAQPILPLDSCGKIGTYQLAQQWPSLRFWLGRWLDQAQGQARLSAYMEEQATDSEDCGFDVVGVFHTISSARVLYTHGVSQ